MGSKKKRPKRVPKSLEDSRRVSQQIDSTYRFEDPEKQAAWIIWQMVEGDEKLFHEVLLQSAELKRRRQHIEDMVTASYTGNDLNDWKKKHLKTLEMQAYIVKNFEQK